MPTYKVTDPQTGRTLKLTGDSPPSEQELDQIFGAYGQPKKTIGGFIGNVGKSAVDSVGGIASSAINVVNPNLEKNTIANLARLGASVLSVVAPGEQGNEDLARQVGQFYVNRYGGVDKAWNSFYNDPVGVAMDVSTVLGGVGAIAKGAGLTKIAGTLSKASSITDPLQVATRVAGTGLRTAGIPFKGVAADVGKELAVKSVRANRTQLDDFAKIAGQDLGDYMIENRLFAGGKGNVSQAEQFLKPLQEEYNSLVRTGKQISRKEYADAIRQRALEILDKDQSLGARSVAETLWKEADQQEKLGPLTDTILTDSKSSSFGKAPRGQIIDPTTYNANVELGGIGIGELDKVGKGSAELGKRLQAGREFQKIASTQSQLGRGAQVVNAFKPFVAGMTSGGVAGTILAPGPGTLVGGLAGAGISLAANNPKVQGVASKVLTTGKVPKIPNSVEKVINVFANTGKTGRFTSPNQVQSLQESQQFPKLQSKFSQSKVNQGTNPSPNYTTPPASPKNLAEIKARNAFKPTPLEYKAPSINIFKNKPVSSKRFRLGEQGGGNPFASLFAPNPKTQEMVRLIHTPYRTASSEDKRKYADMALNLGMMGGLTAPSRLRAIPKPTQQEMAGIIDYVRLKRPFNADTELAASRIAEKYGLRMPKTMNGLANVFDKALSARKFR